MLRRRGGGRAESDAPLHPHVLVVDDTREVRDVFAEFLRSAGIRVTQADGGWAAMAAVCDAVPDLVVTDLSMPDMDGLELCRRIRTDPATSDVPVLVVSGSVPADDAATRAAGCDAILEKPCSRAQLVAAVRALLETTSGMRGVAPFKAEPPPGPAGELPVRPTSTSRPGEPRPE